MKTAKRLDKMMYEPDRKYDDVNDRPEDNSIQKEIHILYFGDYDPSGVDMDVLQDEQIAYFIQYFGLKNIHFHRIAITQEQIKKFKLPSKPRDQSTIEKLNRDTRTDDFKKRHGGKLYAVELDALLAFQPDKFQRLVQDAVAKYYKPEVYQKLVDRPEHSREAIRCLVIKKVKSWLLAAEKGGT